MSQNEQYNRYIHVCLSISGLAPKTMVPLAPAFGSHFLKGRVVSINSKSKTITLGSGQIMSYDVLVICTGTGGPFPFKIDIDTTTEEAVRKYEATVSKVSRKVLTYIMSQ